MPVFAYSIAAVQHRPSQGDGYVRAETIHEAVALVGHPEVNVQPLYDPLKANVLHFISDWDAALARSDACRMRAERSVRRLLVSMLISAFFLRRFGAVAV